MTTPAVTGLPLDMTVSTRVELTLDAATTIAEQLGADAATMTDLLGRVIAGATDAERTAVLAPLVAAGIDVDTLVGLTVASTLDAASTLTRTATA